MLLKPTKQLLGQFNVYLEELLKQFQFSMSQKSVKPLFELQVVEAEEMPLIFTDYKIYESIFFHIFSNAVKFTKAKSVIKIQISFREIAKRNDRV